MVHPELLNLSADDYIVFKDVNLSYSQKSVQNKKYSLKNVNITVKKGEKVAICGRYKFIFVYLYIYMFLPIM